MKCLNPECGSVEAIELNISLNLYEGAEYTDYGDPGELIATSCIECERIVYAANWLDIVLKMVQPTGDDIVLTHTQTNAIVWDDYLNAGLCPVCGQTPPEDVVCCPDLRGGESNG